ncbi:hypothetical protein OsJ_03223 [Oryza sativa Japonica Group]|uniref:Late embryogenesis abundant protein LEA-2 subgroup domain-containing protein n=1 Tax=Oryza sativa subsp. japonica TaxID=39947 RepID=B9EZ38_ORYSJ|nr:hypothetical protein OsJ_03223 [Oryza sativa Japonica Group]
MAGATSGGRTARAPVPEHSHALQLFAIAEPTSVASSVRSSTSGLLLLTSSSLSSTNAPSEVGTSAELQPRHARNIGTAALHLTRPRLQEAGEVVDLKLALVHGGGGLLGRVDEHLVDLCAHSEEGGVGVRVHRNAAGRCCGASQAIDTAVIFNKPISSSVELVGVRGLDPSLAPGAAASPAFDLLLRLDNGDACGDQYREGGSVKVSYAGVPLAHGSTPGFRLGARSSATVAVNATSDGVGVPEELFRLMSAEQRLGVAQLDIGLQLGWPGWESYYWSVDLDG